MLKPIIVVSGPEFYEKGKIPGYHYAVRKPNYDAYYFAWPGLHLLVRWWAHNKHLPQWVPYRLGFLRVSEGQMFSDGKWSLRFWVPNPSPNRDRRYEWLKRLTHRLT